MHRRPLSIRAQKWPLQIAKALSRLGATPNGISLASILFGLLTFLFLMVQPFGDSPWNFFLAALSIQGRLICNLLDGLVAVEGGKKTATGGLYNEVPDRVCDALTLLALGYGCASWPWGSELGYAATIAAFLTAYIRVLGASLGTASYFLGPQAKQQRMAVCTVALFLTGLSGSTLFLWLALVVVFLGSLFTSLRRLRAISQELEKNSP